MNEDNSHPSTVEDHQSRSFCYLQMSSESESAAAASSAAVAVDGSKACIADHTSSVAA